MLGKVQLWTMLTNANFEENSSTNYTLCEKHECSLLCFVSMVDIKIDIVGNILTKKLSLL